MVGMKIIDNNFDLIIFYEDILMILILELLYFFV